MSNTADETFVPLTLDQTIWTRFFTISPLVVVGTKEADGHDLAPKHLAMPMSWDNLFGFVCTPDHATYRNARETGEFTVSFPRPDQIVLAGLAAAPRSEIDGCKWSLQTLDTVPGQTVDAPLLADAYVHLECSLERIIDDLGANSLIIGRIVAARVASEALRVSDLDDGDLIDGAPLLAYIAPGRYAAVGRTNVFPLPDGFHR